MSHDQNAVEDERITGEVEMARKNRARTTCSAPLSLNIFGRSKTCWVKQLRNFWQR